MSIRVRQLEIRIETMRGKFGVVLPMSPGLVVIRAHNTSGKSTCVQSLIYALGLEAMLTSNQQTPPLQYAVLERFQYGEEEIAVGSSEVFVEFENSEGDIITVQRAIKSAVRSTDLITVWNGPYLTEHSSEISKTDLFVRFEGAAQRPLGFHNFLANFLGWELPIVTRFDGSECPLYLQCLFPLFIVEQKHGWSGIQARMPLHFRIREMSKRAIEFVLKLDSYAIAAQRQRMREQLSEIEKKWKNAVVRLDAQLLASGAIIRNLPPEPRLEWPLVPAPACLVSTGTNWATIDSALQTTQTTLAEIAKTPVQTVTSDLSRVQRHLREKQKELAAYEVLFASAAKDTEVELAQNESIVKRLKSLNLDLQTYKDVRRLRDIGSTMDIKSAAGRCPTCDQEITGLISETLTVAPPMSVEENVRYIEGQISVFDSMLADSQRVIDARQRSLTSLRLKMDELRSEIRTYKQTLTSEGKGASAADVRDRLTLEGRVEKYMRLRNEVDTAIEALAVLAGEFIDLHQRLEELKSDTSENDEAKLSQLQHSFVSQLEQYGFSSIKPASLLRISRESYRPTYDGFDLGFNLSASDMIRTIWAYLYGLLEVARQASTNHPGLLVLDEPRQQQADKVSFTEFARRTAESLSADQQVILLTSEDEATLELLLSGVNYQYWNFPGEMKMIGPLSGGGLINNEGSHQ